MDAWSLMMHMFSMQSFCEPCFSLPGGKHCGAPCSDLNHFPLQPCLLLTFQHTPRHDSRPEHDLNVLSRMEKALCTQTICQHWVLARFLFKRWIIASTILCLKHEINNSSRPWSLFSNVPVFPCYLLHANRAPYTLSHGPPGPCPLHAKGNIQVLATTKW